MQSLIQRLSDSFFVKTFDFSGHGTTPFVKDFGINQFTQELDRFILAEGFGDAYIFGYSMGGYVALDYFKNVKHAIRGLFTLGTKMQWSPDIALNEIKHLQVDIIKQKVPKFALALEKRHGSNWELLMQKTVDMMLDLGNGSSLSGKDLEEISLPVCIARGSEDSMVSEEESKWAANLMGGTYLELNGIQHPIERVPLERIEKELNSWIESVKNN
jgi:pimeloyl-ACP methyl ester carboxylesterase